jgi:guanylate kinase
MTRDTEQSPTVGAAGTAGDSKGRLFIVSAPSGAGKSTLCQAVRHRFGDLAYSISYTTRAPRTGEIDGQDYFFIDASEFERGIQSGRWAEWARVHGNYYGTSAQWIENTLARGRTILLDIDVQGTRQMVARFPRAVTIFILPPSMEELERRLRQRGTDDAPTIAVRMQNARQEMEQKDLYQHIVINDDLNRAIGDLIALLECNRRSGCQSGA